MGKMITYKLYNGQIVLSFDKDNHTYWIDDRPIFGVTSITNVPSKPALRYWVAKEIINYLTTNLPINTPLDEVQKQTLLQEARKSPFKKRDKTADVGTLIHNWLEEYVKSVIAQSPPPKPPVNPQMKSAINSFLKWTKTHKVKFISSEQKVYSKKYDYAGTLDLEADVDGKRTIIDFKTGRAIYPEMTLQAVAYLQAKEEEEEIKYNGGVKILRLSQTDDPFEVMEIERKKVPELLKVFIACLTIYRWRIKLKGEEINGHNIQGKNK
jgi:hypothetical protein